MEYCAVVIVNVLILRTVESLQNDRRDITEVVWIVNNG
jgi:hypothetical protein